MSATETPPALDLDAEWAAALDRIRRGVRDPDAMDRAAREMDEGREEIRRRLGATNLAGDLTDRDDE